MYSILNNEPEPLQKYYPDSPSELIHILDRSLEKETGERYQSINDILIELKRMKKKFGSIKSDVMESNETLKFNWIFKGYRFWIVTVGLITIISVVYFLINLFEFGEMPIWEQKRISLTQITAASNSEIMGKISPNGQYLAYWDMYDELIIRDIETGSERSLNSELKSIRGITWEPNNHSLLVHSYDYDGWYMGIYNILTGEMLNKIPIMRFGLYSSWAPNGSKIAYIESYDSSFIKIIDKNNTVKNLFTSPKQIAFLAWSPDSKKIAFFMNGDGLKAIHILDVETKTVSDPLEGSSNCRITPWSKCGLTWSIDGNYIVYIGRYEKNYEILALPINKTKTESLGTPKSIHQFYGECEPFWPTFTNDGKIMSFGKSEDNYDIYVASIDINNKKITGILESIAISDRNDYDPNWTPDGKSIIFVSSQHGQKDIYQYNLETGGDDRKTRTETSEEKPQISPDGKYLSYFYNGSIHYKTLKGIKEVQSTPDSLNLRRNYAWSMDSRFLFLVKRRSDPRISDILKFDIDKRTLTVILPETYINNICTSFDGNYLAVSAVIMEKNNIKAKIYILDINSQKIINTFYNSFIAPRGILSWTKNSKFVLNDQKKNPRWVLLPIEKGEEQEITMNLPQLENKEFYIDKISPLGDKIIIRVLEKNNNIWLARFK